MATKTANKNSLKAFEEAREAIVRLKTLKRFLTSADLETLEILLDKQSMETLSKSVEEARTGKYEPIKKIS